MADWQRNAYYKAEEDYLFALADALREEYEAIVAAGFLLQVDDPHLVTYWIKEPDLTLAQFRKWAEVRVEALNHALRNIPPDRIVTTPATASIWGRASTTSNSNESSTSS